MLNNPARAVVHLRTDDVTGVRAAYHRVSKDLLEVPGLLGNELMRSVHDPAGFIVVSSWEDLRAFQEWERGPDHRDQTAPLRPFQDGRMNPPFGIYHVVAAY